MLKSQNRDGSLTSPVKQKKKEQILTNHSNKLPTITRSADSKYKSAVNRDYDDSIITDRPKSTSTATTTNYSPVKPLDLQSMNNKKSNRHSIGGGIPITQPKKLKLLPPANEESNSQLSFDEKSLRDNETQSFIPRVISNDELMSNANDDSSIGKNSLDNNNNDTASSSLSLKYVHGYDGDCLKTPGAKVTGKNIFWLTDDIIIYPTATLVVLLNTKSPNQYFYRSHTEEVSTLTIHPDKQIIASGQMGKDSRILIWDSRLLFQNDNLNSPSNKNGRLSPRYEPPPDPSLTYIREIYLENKTRGVLGLNFSSDGFLLAALGLDESKSIFIYDWNKNELLATIKMGHIDVFQIGFNPFLFIPSSKNIDNTPSSPTNNNNNHINNRINNSKIPIDDNVCCYTLISAITRGTKFWVLRRIKERNDIVAIAGNGSQFKGRKIAVPKHKQSWAWKYVLEGNIGLFPKKNNNTPPDMTCFTIISEPTEPGRLPRSKILTGGSNGSIYIWQQLEAGAEDTSREDYTPQYWLPRGRLLCVISDVQDGPLYDLDAYIHPNISLKYRIGTCGKDGILNIWDLNSNNISSDVSPMEHLTAINIANHSTIIGFPRSIQWCVNGHFLIVGTTGNTICLVRGHGLGNDTSPQTNLTMEGNHNNQLPTNEHTSSIGDLRLDILMNSHVGRINRVVSHPFQDIYVTIGVDKSVRVWSIQFMTQIAFTRVASSPTSLTFVPDGSAVTIGTEVGEILILTCTYFQKILETGEEPRPTRKRVKWDLLGRKFIGTKVNSKGKDGVKQKNLSPCEITELRYSPDGEYLVAAGRDKTIHIISAKVILI